MLLRSRQIAPWSSGKDVGLWVQPLSSRRKVLYETTKEGMRLAVAYKGFVVKESQRRRFELNEVQF